MKVLFNIAILCWVLNNPTLADQPNFKFKHLTTNEGLSNSQIHCVYQDSYGYIWIGTNNGLNRYDGVSLEVFRYDPQVSTSLRGNSVNCIVEDVNGDLLVGTSEGLHVYNQKLQSFTYLPLWENYTVIKDVFIDSKGVKWVSTEGRGIYCVSKDKNQIVALKDKNVDLDLMNVNQVFEDSQGVFWIATQDQGVLIYEEESNQVNKFSVASKAPVMAIVEDNKKMIWIATEGAGLFMFNRYTQDITHYGRNTPMRLPDNRLHDLWASNDGKIWIASTGGIAILDPIGKEVHSYRPEISNSHSLNSYSIRNIYADQQGNFWIGTYNGGVNILSNNKNKFNAVKSGMGFNNEWPSVLSAYSVSMDSTWLGLDGQGLTLLIDGKVEENFNKETIRGFDISSVFAFEKTDQGLYLATYNHGLVHWNFNSNQFKYFKHDPQDSSSLSQNFVRDILRDSNNNLWVLTNGGGLNLFDKKEEEFEHFKCDDSGSNSSICSDYGLTLYEGADGYIWIGTYGGLSRFDPHTRSFKNYWHQRDSSGSLSYNWVYSILEDSENRLWVGTANGLNLLNKEDDTFIKLYSSDGLPDNVIDGMLEDENGYLWVSTNNGLARLKNINITDEGVEAEIKSYDVSDDLQSNEFNKNSALVNAKGELFFGGVSGYNYFDPDDIRGNAFVAQVYVKEVLVNNRPFHDWREDIDYRDATYGTLIILPSDYNTLSFRFTSLNYVNAEKNQFVYKMEGVDDDWVQAQAGRVASYTQLPPGNYTFIVKASNNDGLWNEQGATVVFKIQAPFYWSWYAKVFYVLLLIVSLWLFRNFSIMKGITSGTIEAGIVSDTSMRTFIKQSFSSQVLLESAEREQQVNVQDQEFMVTINELIELNLDNERFQVEEIDKVFGISRPLLIKKLKSMTGMTVVEYIRNYRLDRAEILLREENLNISEVAYRVGFNDPKYFSKAFKQKFGHSPSELKGVD